MRVEVLDRVSVEFQVSAVAAVADGGVLETRFKLAAGQTITLTNPRNGRQARSTVLEVDASVLPLRLVTFRFAKPETAFW